METERQHICSNVVKIYFVFEKHKITYSSTRGERNNYLFLISLYCTINHEQISYEYNGICINSPLDTDTPLTITLSKELLPRHQYQSYLRRSYRQNSSNTLLFTNFSRQTIPTMTFLTLAIFGAKRTWCLHRY